MAFFGLFFKVIFLPEREIGRAVPCPPSNRFRASFGCCSWPLISV
jgi:hypothetical protein